MYTIAAFDSRFAVSSTFIRLFTATSFSSLGWSHFRVVLLSLMLWYHVFHSNRDWRCTEICSHLQILHTFDLIMTKQFPKLMNKFISPIFSCVLYISCVFVLLWNFGVTSYAVTPVFFFGTLSSSVGIMKCVFRWVSALKCIIRLASSDKWNRVLPMENRRVWAQ